MRILGPVALLAALLLVATSDTPAPAQPRQRFIIVGFDGMDPLMADRLMAEGKLPHLAWMRDHGAMRHLETTNPAQSPVAWSAFSTGMNPGKTRIYDFLKRNPVNYYPDFSTVTVRRGKFALGLIPTRAPQVINNRQGETFWHIASSRGVQTAVLMAPIDFPPERLQNGVLLSGLGVPDIRGTMGTFSYYATDAVGAADTEMGGKVDRLRVGRDGRARSVVHGPRRPFGQRDAEGRIPDMTLPITFQRLKEDPPSVRIALQGQVRTVREGTWSDWFTIRFTIAPLITVQGIGRFYVLQAFPELRVYLSPINLDPRRPPVPVSQPPSFSADLARRLGLFKTLGWPEDTWALNEEKIDERVFLEDLNYTFSRQRTLVLDVLGRTRPDLFVTVFQATDKVQHMFWRLIDPQHPVYNRRLAAQYGDAIDRVYMRCDSLVGQLLPLCRDGRTTLLVVSDHGFASFRKAVNINTWLVRNGYMKLSKLDPVRDRNLEDLFGRGTFWPNVDWNHTRAYALALGQIYVNRMGRESHGIVRAGAEYDSVRDGIVREFEMLRDPDTGERVVHKVYKSEEIFHGPFFQDAPDMVVGFERGYRVSWQTSLGGIPPEVIEPNERRWSADHCSVDPSEVPGVFFASRPVQATDPHIIDVAPTVLTGLGVTPPAAMDGRDLGLQ
jgi:predicted AlkP superfamily phosphohydrolase/phosphomutase